MRGSTSSVVLFVGMVVLSSPGIGAEIAISIDKTAQRMTVSVDGEERYSWPVSTGMADYATPTGAFTPSRLVKQHYSREWDNAPMPYSIFFTDAGHAIHGSHATSRLGSPASHGCIRLSPGNARILFNLVMAEGPDNTRIVITGVDPIGTALRGGYGAGRDYSRLTSFDPLTDGIMAGGSATRQRREIPGRP
ncbi:L,D-transpeptidase [Microvirga lenta]|uniref:L,D-transpeptidase n=1 Tax=Microvirga lenta TaxID=2881337 RepID=UPI001CFF82E3|nr:L,D-transpeptidase [Microvirga lenta]MCB5176452.1 L,D-transpeptidase [Microvirga lenta]